MANQEHLNILEQGVKVWNQWRKQHPDIQPDLSGADLRMASLGDMMRINLNGVNLKGANLSRSGLRGAQLNWADLSEAHLTGSALNQVSFFKSRLSGASLFATDCYEADFTEADLSEASLVRAGLHEANFISANLAGADLTSANFSGANLAGANFNQARVWLTMFGNVDLSQVKGLETVFHDGPSTIGIDTIYLSKGNIPGIFLQGAGIDETFIAYIRSLVGKPIEYYSCFISYSSKDEAFAKRLHADLRSNNIRCWFAPEDLKIGDKFRHRIDESIRMYDKLLLVLSEASIASTWVGYEVEKALDKEPEGKPNVLFPIRLDKAILTCETDWAKDIRKSRHIGDFEHWKDHDAYQVAFERLLRDLKAQS